MNNIEIEVNGERKLVPQEITIRALLDLLGIPALCAVERNKELVPRARHAETIVQSGDVLEIVHFVGGG